MKSISGQMNGEIIAFNIAEAHKQVRQIEQRLLEGEPFPEEEFQNMVRRTCHYLNFAWDVRFQSIHQGIRNAGVNASGERI